LNRKKKTTTKTHTTHRTLKNQITLNNLCPKSYKSNDRLIKSNDRPKFKSDLLRSCPPPLASEATLLLPSRKKEFELNFTHSERNPSGMFAFFLTPNVTLQSKAAELLEDGHTCEPAFRAYTFFIKNVKQMLHELEKAEFFAEALLRDHQVMANAIAIAKKEDRQTHEVEYRFPSGVTCNAKHHFKNKPSPDNRLKNNKSGCAQSPCFHQVSTRRGILLSRLKSSLSSFGG
jgi:hypothetical protein